MHGGFHVVNYAGLYLASTMPGCARWLDAPDGEFSLDDARRLAEQLAPCRVYAKDGTIVLEAPLTPCQRIA